MRILIVSGIFHPDVGGPATYLHELAHALKRSGHDVGVVAYSSSAGQIDYPFPVWRVPRTGSQAARMFRFIRTLFEVSASYPLWYVNDYGLPAAIVGMVRRPVIVMKIVGDFAWEYSRRHGFTAEGIDSFQSRRSGLRIRLLKLLQSVYARRAARIIVPSRYLAEIVTGWGVPGDRVRVVYNAVDVAHHHGSPQSPPDLEPGSLVVLTAARLAPWKGIDHLLRAFRIVAGELDRARLVIAGDGPDRSRLEELADELGLRGRVLWLGNVDRRDLLSWMSHARLFALLSEYEGFSHVLLEAMALGVPVVASAAGGNPELVRDDRDGILVRPADHQSTARTMIELLKSESQQFALAAASRKRGSEFTWNRLLDATMAVFVESSRGGAPASGTAGG
jgi:glycosyltransferase involved in cell wall biosynthesis